jgi:hypothetical protein
MDLKIIEYGSLASSEIMNNNFSYLDEKIETNSEATNTAVSSLLSNIATINTRLNDLVETFGNAIETVNTKIDDYKNKTKLMISENSMIPNWMGCVAIENLYSYVIQKSGYLLLILEGALNGEIFINDVAIPLNPTISYLPVKEVDIISSSLENIKAYYIPATFVSIENF